jgi:hypothetical protein
MKSKLICIVIIAAMIGCHSAVAGIARPRTQTRDTELQPVATDLNVQITEVRLFSAPPVVPGGPVGPAPHVRMRWTVSHPPFIHVLGFITRVTIEFANGETKTLTQTADPSVREVNLTFTGSSPALHFEARVETRFDALVSTAIVTSSDRFVLNKSNNFDSHGSAGPGTSPAGPLVRLTEVKNGPQGFTASWVATPHAGLTYTAFELAGDAAFSSPAGTTTRQVTARAGGSARQATLSLGVGGPIPSGDGLIIVISLTIKAFGTSTSTRITERAGDF